MLGFHAGVGRLSEDGLAQVSQNGRQYVNAFAPKQVAGFLPG